MSKTKTQLLIGAISGLTALNQTARAVEFVVAPTLEIQVANYKEDDTAANNVTTSRYDIATLKTQLVWPLDNNAQIRAALDYEIMSGASPQFNVPNAQEQSDVVWSGASKIEDSRLDASVSIERGDAQQGHTFGGSYSKEDDYQSSSLNASYWESYSASSTILFALAHTRDSITPVEGFGSVSKAKKNGTTVSAAIDKTLNRSTKVKWGVSVAVEDGYLSDPYKRTYINSSVAPDQRPEARRSVAVQQQFRHWIDTFNAALHLDYQFFTDDWGLQSHALTTRWAQSFDNGWLVTPKLRYYTQNGADFYAPFYYSNDSGLQSSDYRLAPFGALSAGIEISKTLNRDLQVSLSYEQYTSDESLAPYSITYKNPGLVDFNVITLGFKKTFAD